MAEIFNKTSEDLEWIKIIANTRNSFEQFRTKKKLQKKNLKRIFVQSSKIVV